jgi:hypothetical protein
MKTFLKKKSHKVYQKVLRKEKELLMEQKDLQLEMCGTKKIILYRDRDRDQKKNVTGTRTGTDKKLPGPTLESEVI